MASKETSTGEVKVLKSPNFLTVLRNRNFRNLWLGQVVSQVGDYFAFLALMVVVTGFATDAQNTTLVVSGMMISFTLPRLLFGLLAGVFVDRWDRRRTMLVSDLVRMVLTLAMIPAFMSHNLWGLYALAFVNSSFGTLFNPAKGALIPKLVSSDELMSANTLSQTSQMLATLLGPAIAGGVFYAVGSGNEWIAFVVDSISFGISALAILFMRVPAEITRSATQATVAASGAVRQVWSEMLVGLRVLALNRAVTTITAVMAVTMLGVGAVNVLFVVLLKERFNLDSASLALQVSGLDIANAGAMVASSILIGNFLAHLAPKWFIVVALVGAGTGIALFGYLPEYWQMIGAMIVVGAFVAPLNSGTSTLVQLIVPNEQLGRVGGGIGTVTDLATLGSMSLAGVLAAWLGVPTVFLIAGLAGLAGALLAWAFLPGIKAGKPTATAEATTERMELGGPSLDGAVLAE